MRAWVVCVLAVVTALVPVCAAEGSAPVLKGDVGADEKELLGPEEQKALAAWKSGRAKVVLDPTYTPPPFYYLSWRDEFTTWASAVSYDDIVKVRWSDVKGYREEVFKPPAVLITLDEVDLITEKAACSVKMWTTGNMVLGGKSQQNGNETILDMEVFDGSEVEEVMKILKGAPEDVLYEVYGDGKVVVYLVYSDSKGYEVVFDPEAADILVKPWKPVGWSGDRWVFTDGAVVVTPGRKLFVVPFRPPEDRLMRAIERFYSELREGIWDPSVLAGFKNVVALKPSWASGGGSSGGGSSGGGGGSSGLVGLPVVPVVPVPLGRRRA